MAGLTLANEVLGYPRDARLLIVNADDFGMCHSQNLGTLHALQQGVASSCSLMMPAPWALHGIHLLRENRAIPFAVHLTCVSEYAYYRWKPLSRPEAVPTLIDATGHFYSDADLDALARHAALPEIELEFQAQIEAALAAGLSPTHLDCHYLFNELRADIFELTVGLALRYGLALRVHAPAHAAQVRARGYPTCDHPLLNSGAIDPADKAAELERRLRELPPGLSEWAMHPGVANDELRAVMSGPSVPGITGTPAGRQTDLDFLVSPLAGEIIKAEGIIVLSYAPVQQAWRRTLAAAPLLGRGPPRM